MRYPKYTRWNPSRRLGMPISPLYIDATTGGLGLQMLLATAVGSLVTVRLFWGRLFSFFRKSEPDTEESPAAGDVSPEAVEEEN
jgi:hypothetical protein